jgi:hypothetical protein
VLDRLLAQTPEVGLTRGGVWNGRAAERKAAVAAARPTSHATGFEDSDAHPGLCEDARASEAGDAAAHDGDVDPLVTL